MIECLACGQQYDAWKVHTCELYCIFCEILMRLCLGHGEEFSQGQPRVGITWKKLQEFKKKYDNYSNTSGTT